jgi:hypothetical protein
MPQFPLWEQQVAAMTDAVQLRQAQLNQVVSDLVARARDVTNSIPAGAAEIASRTRRRLEHLPDPASVVEEIRRRVNLLELATRGDVEVQSRLGRNRVSFVLQEFLDAQRGHDATLLETLRTELREELQTFAAAVDDNLFSVGGDPPALDARAPRRTSADLDYLLDDDDEEDDDDEDDMDLVDYDGTLAADD